MADISIDGFCHRAVGSSSRNGGMVAEDARSYVDRGRAWAQIGAYEQALEAWTQALRLAPDLADVYAATGSVYMTLGCWQEAVRSYQQAIQVAPHLLESYYGLGSAYGRLGEYGRAIEAYEQAFQHLPTSGDQSREAVVLRLDAPASRPIPVEPDAFQDRMRTDTEGFDFTALLSSPNARRQAVRQEQASAAPAPIFDTVHITGVDTFRQEIAAPTPRDLSTGLRTDPKREATSATVSTVPNPETEAAEEPYVTPVRDRRAYALLTVLLIILGCMGGRMAIRAVNEARDRDAYLAASRASQNRRGLSEQPSSGRGSQ